MAWVECQYVATLPEGELPPFIEPTPVTASAVASDEFDITIDGVPI
jgi:hypothetical protein